jgi:hypothetical protein
LLAGCLRRVLTRRSGVDEASAVIEVGTSFKATSKTLPSASRKLKPNPQTDCCGCSSKSATASNSPTVDVPGRPPARHRRWVVVRANLCLLVAALAGCLAPTVRAGTVTQCERSSCFGRGSRAGRIRHSPTSTARSRREANARRGGLPSTCVGRESTPPSSSAPPRFALVTCRTAGPTIDAGRDDGRESVHAPGIPLRQPRGLAGSGHLAGSVSGSGENARTSSRTLGTSG